MSIQHYANKQKREELSTKSMRIYGRRSRWKKMMKEYGITVAEVEKVLNDILERIENKNVQSKEV